MIAKMTFAAALVALVLAACNGATPAGGKRVGSIFDPVCAPDGSNVYVLYPNSEGRYEPSDVSRENCPWNK